MKVKTIVLLVMLIFTPSCKKAPEKSLLYWKLFYDSLGTPGGLSLTPTEGSDTNTGTNNSGIDTIPPVPGNSGSLVISERKATSMKLSWTVGADNITDPTNIEYKVVGSTSSNIGMIEEMETTGSGRILLVDWTKNISQYAVLGLTVNIQYYFNIEIKDSAGNKAIYATANGLTPPVYDNMDGTITDTNRNVTWMKCSAGQVWNQTNNDCTGIGNSGNNYSVGYFQYCATASHSCNNTGSPNWDLNGNGTSGLWTYCDNLELGGRTNWRVPNHSELLGMYADVYSQSTYQFLFPQTGLAFYWTASADSTTPYFLHPNPEQRAWIIHFQTGINYAYIGNSDGLKTNNALLRCVTNGL
ncbi:MAG: DUF1566 domain-containing protein [Leptospiraceae bacterium]|nr:DUF1566 domain-containing protein [Leptospiraceae bacterium]